MQKLTDTDRIVLRDADSLKVATATDGLERGRGLLGRGDDVDSGPLQKGDAKHVDIPAAPKGTRDLGYEHTQPKGPGSNLFSHGDLADLRSGQRAYLISPDGQIQVYDKSANTIWEIRPGTVDPTILRPKREFLIP
jgi:hypothetical protein